MSEFFGPLDSEGRVPPRQQTRVAAFLRCRPMERGARSSTSIPCHLFVDLLMAADAVIVTAENIVPVGVIAPDHVVTPGPLVDYLVSNG